MAAEAAVMPVNGNYAPHAGYGGIEQQQQNNHAYGATNNISSQAASKDAAAASAAGATVTAPGPDGEVTKDEVGWYFVEQYYTTLSRSPEKLYLFYNKRSQFVSGQETDKVSVCVGQRAINDRIKTLDFHDCKVRVTNVDSQASDSNIVIQVIGEISNKSQPHKKFTQTFVLATQTNGYFVLNDIFRYLIDEEDETEQEAEPEAEQVKQTQSGYQEPVPTASGADSKGLTSSSDPTSVEEDAKQVDKELEQKVLIDQPKTEELSQPAVNGVSESENAPTAEPPSTAEVTRAVAVEEEAKPEKPKAPEQTPAASPPKTATPQPAPAPKPAAPKTWASLAASANRGPAPAAPSSSSSSTATVKPAPSSSKPAAATTSNSTATPAAPVAPAAQRDPSPAEGSTGTGDEWTAVGSSHNRQQSRQMNNHQDGPQNRGYIKNVHDHIDGNELRAQLETCGELAYFDISRQKNCAFVDFKTPEGYQNALAANPHVVGGERLNVEERRYRRPDGQFVPRGQYQGNRGGRGGPGNGQGAPRGNFQGGRGGAGYAPRGGAGGRGGAGAPRGRGSSQAI